jgi:UDPglucose--hexose-1-phosphate uridylyltransferase
VSILRKDPVSSGWVIISEERAERPQEYKVCEEKHKTDEACPLCGGHEAMTPPEIVAYRAPGTAPNTPGWRVRTISNKYAALRIEGELSRRGEGIYDTMNGVGAHEVVVESPRHEDDMAHYGLEKMSEVIRMYRERATDLLRDTRFKYIQIFRNYGSAAGASLSHPHSQIIALPITPRWVKEELGCAWEHYELKERCLFCDIVNQELDTKSRLVHADEAFVSFEPFASKFPFETWIIPRRHYAEFTQIRDDEIERLAVALPRTLLALKQALSDPPYNFIVHSAPRLEEDRPGVESLAEDYHWHIEIYPRISRIAGFEWGTGFYINTVMPEKAAEFLRQALEDNP